MKKRKRNTVDTVAITKSKLAIDKSILKQVKNKNNIVYGGRALRANLGWRARPFSRDWDVYSQQPKRDATQLTQQLI